MHERRKLIRATRHVYAGRLIVEAQRQLVACLAAQGQYSGLAEQTLRAFIKTLESLEHCERMLRERARSEPRTSRESTLGSEPLQGRAPDWWSEPLYASEP